MKSKIIVLLIGFLWVSSLSAQNINAKPKKKKHFTYSSFYYTTKSDSTKLAVDVFLPKHVNKGDKVPTIFYLTRYIRSLRLRKFFRWIQNPYFGQVKKEEVNFFTKNGYAVVILDARGSGASYGNRMMDFTPQEMEDGSEVIDWVVAQDWSNGNVGTTGISYLGTTSELILSTKNPAIKAAIPRSNIYDLYADISFPGGVRQGPFVKVWGFTTHHLDYNDWTFIKGLSGVLEGVNPVMGDTDKVQLKEAVNQHHENYDVFNEILRIEFRDELHPVLQQPIDNFSIHSNTQTIEESGVPVFRIGGWYDGALANSLFRGFWNNKNTNLLLIGPWDHGPRDNASPFAKTHKVKYKVYEDMLGFFDSYLKPGTIQPDESLRQIKYFTVGEEKWKITNEWPPANTSWQKWYFAIDTTVIQNGFGPGGEMNVGLRYDIGTGGGSRYNSQTTLYKYAKHTGYPKRKQQTDSLFYFETTPTDKDVTITGHIQAQLTCSFPTEDATIFVYLDEVTPKGKVNYITEGMFRVIHRTSTDSEGYVTPGLFHSFKQTDSLAIVPNEKMEISFSLLPISYKVTKGSKIRISFTGVDPDHFDVPKLQPEYMHLFLGGRDGSYLYVPIEPGN